MAKTKIKRIGLLSAALLLALANFVFLSTSSANASSLSNTYLRLNRMESGTATSFRLVFKTASAGATTVAINFNGIDTGTSQWTNATPGGLVNTTQTADSSSCAADTGATALPGTLSASGSSATISITGVTALSATTSYCVDLTSASAVTTPTAGHEGEYHPTITVGSDSTNVSVDIVANDQVVVNATVPPTFNFGISGCSSNTDNFTANLSVGSVGSTGGCTVTINTNAKPGWFAWASDNNTGLHSVVASKTVASTTPGTNATLSGGTEGYVLGVTSITQGSGGGTTSASNAYGNGSGGTAGAAQGSGLDGTFRQIASSNGTASSASFVVKERAAISALTPAATDYTDTITVIGAGSF
jgi:hypothetical protein